MNQFLNFARPDRFLKPVRSLLLLMLLVFCTATFAAPTTPTSDFIDNNDGTVTHKLTGLVWMRCSMGQTWDKATASCTGTAATYTWDAAMALKSNFAGKSDWRLPNIWELHTIVEWENPSLTINTTIFPDTSNTRTWSSSPVSYYNTKWGFNFVDGLDGDAYSYSSQVVRFVRGGQPFSFLPLTTPNNDFIDNQDGTLTHKRTGLVWQRCSVGQIWTGSTCSGTASTYTFSQAIALTNTFAGHSDWRLPTENELLSIAEYGASNPAINTTLFPNTPSGWVWSSTSSIRYNGIWDVYYYNGVSSYDGKFYNDTVRLVRGQWANALPKITSITPTQAIIGKPTVFTVKGTNLNPHLGFSVGDCQYSNVALAGGTAQQQRFLCTQFGKAGTKRGIIKTETGGTLLKQFNVNAVLVPNTTTQASLTGQIKIGALPAANVVVSSGDDSTDACITDLSGKFRCQVPENWTGVLIADAKGVSFSPVVIYVRNASGEKSLNDPLTGVAFKGSSDDIFPMLGFISSDWKKLTTDYALWKLEIANGEADDQKSYEGRFSLRSAKIAANQNSAIQTTINVTQSRNVKFARRVSSNEGHGVLTFLIDGTVQGSWSGELGWEMQEYPLGVGLHTLRWEYKKDAEAAKGLDAAWIDAVSYPSSVKAAQAGTITKINCQGITAGTVAAMTIKNPTCAQLQAYLGWLKVVRPLRMAETDDLTNNVKNIENSNELAQKVIETGGKIFSLRSILKTTNLPEKMLSGYVEVASGAGGVGCDLISDPVKKEACDNAKTGFLTLVDFGIKNAAKGTLGTVSVYPYAVEKTFSIGFNLGYAAILNSNTEKLNSINIANEFLEAYYLGGMNFSAMCSKYGVSCSTLNPALVDAFANAKGYHNDWYGTEYLNDMIIISVNDAITKNKAILSFALSI
jgi:hypothetical protein